MRITRKTYEKACESVEAAREQLKVVKLWDEAVKRLGDLGNQQLVAITVNDDGGIRTECELRIDRSSSTALGTDAMQDVDRSGK